MISHDSLYLITGFYKALSWSLAAFENAAGSGEFSAQFKIGQVGGSNITGSYTWETTCALDWRVGPAENYGFPNQSRVEVKADAPSTNAKHGKFSDGVKRNSWMSKVWKGLSRNSRSGTSMQDEVVHGLATDEASGYYLSRELLGDAEKHVVVQPMPEFSEIFHPSDIINQYLFKKENSVNVAVTRDNDWITLLDEGKLKPEDFVQMNSSRVEEIIANNFHVVSQEERSPFTNSDVATDNNADQPPASPPIGTKGREDVPDDSFNTPVDVEAPLPAYGMESPERRESTDVTEKPCLLPESLGGRCLTRDYPPSSD
ncbi:hypothetical protein JVT61DRAFT_9118 [Boletus reticuloceps]|uniref:Uncharacterized protein n=1 Tax=Boletus reticuloceps TaxID=495285 RepID=A0A8I3A613_9AGAM|nr:hypothetical protein JVT61DRAFT_9118 [Boletus reticuloceps]